jgi:hypothetical protein
LTEQIKAGLGKTQVKFAKIIQAAKIGIIDAVLAECISQQTKCGVCDLP